MLASLRHRLTGYGDVRTVVAVGESPQVALNRVEAAGRASAYPVSRSDTRVTIGGPPLNDHLIVDATRMDVGTRVEIRGHIEPKLTHLVLQALAKSRPWTWAPAWDDDAG